MVCQPKGSPSVSDWAESLLLATAGEDDESTLDAAPVLLAAARADLAAARAALSTSPSGEGSAAEVTARSALTSLRSARAAASVLEQDASEQFHGVRPLQRGLEAKRARLSGLRLAERAVERRLEAGRLAALAARQAAAEGGDGLTPLLRLSGLLRTCHRGSRLEAFVAKRVGTLGERLRPMLRSELKVAITAMRWPRVSSGELAEDPAIVARFDEALARRLNVETRRTQLFPPKLPN